MNMTSSFMVFVIVLWIVLWPELGSKTVRIPVLGLVAMAGLLIAIFSKGTSSENLGIIRNFSTHDEWIRPFIIAGLLIPQVFLTLANSVLATDHVCKRYFGNQASRVSVKSLLYSIGVGNILMSSFGGMPFCHGSGGITAHVRGGSTRAGSTALIGVVLVILGFVQFFKGGQTLAYPVSLVTVLLIATGIFHLRLALPTAQSFLGCFKLVSAVILTFLTKNLLWVVGFALMIEIADIFILKRPAYDSV